MNKFNSIEQSIDASLRALTEAIHEIAPSRGFDIKPQALRPDEQKIVDLMEDACTKLQGAEQTLYEQLTYLEKQQSLIQKYMYRDPYE